MKSNLFFIHALSPLHPGTGQGVGVVDLPVSREKATGLPQSPGSSIKGVLRDLVPDQNPEKAEVFGPEKDAKSNDYASAIMIGDARLLCLPVRSFRGGFAWVTCPYVLQRVARDWQAPVTYSVGATVPDQGALVPGTIINNAPVLDSALVITTGNNRKVYLDEFDLLVDTTATGLSFASLWANAIGEALFKPGPKEPHPHLRNDDLKKAFVSRFMIVSDMVFSFFAESGLEIVARNSIDDNTGTVKNGALWYEECLPAESILWGVMITEKPKRSSSTLNDDKATLNQVRTWLQGYPEFQLGGKATTGRGRVRMVITEGLS